MQAEKIKNHPLYKKIPLAGGARGVNYRIFNRRIARAEYFMRALPIQESYLSGARQ